MSFKIILIHYIISCNILNFCYKRNLTSIFNIENEIFKIVNEMKSLLDDQKIKINVDKELDLLLL